MNVAEAELDRIIAANAVLADYHDTMNKAASAPCIRSVAVLSTLSGELARAAWQAPYRAHAMDLANLCDAGADIMAGVIGKYRSDCVLQVLTGRP